MRATREVVRVDRSGEGGEEDVPRVGRDVTGQECMTPCRRGMSLCGQSSLLTLNRRRVGQPFRGNSRTTGCRSSPPPNFSKIPRSRARCGFRNFRFDSYAVSVRIAPNVCNQSPRKISVNQQFRPFGVPKGREGLRELQTRGFFEKSYAHSVAKKPENVDSRLVLTGKIASDRTLAPFRIFGTFRQSTKSRARATVSERGRSRLFARVHLKTNKRKVRMRT